MATQEKNRVIIFDTTLRDGGQTQGVDFTVADRRSPAYSDLTLTHVLFNDGTPANTTTHGSVTLVGIDGAPRDVIRPGLENGLLPNFARGIQGRRNGRCQVMPSLE